jgi:alkyl sulfatase BDS1-like metallo-beta-lactamase superfamily hydrolase
MNTRGYYGTVRHNVKGVYQHYIGWFDAHPANLDALPPVDAGKRYVTLFGGTDAGIAAAQKSYDAGDFRWAAEVLKHVVYAEPQNTQARALLAQAFEQMGYQAESAAWRNFYLTGALELRDGPPQTGFARDRALDMLQHTPIERFLEAIAASINGPKADGLALKVNFVFSDLAQTYALAIENGVMHHKKAAADSTADASLTMTKAFFLKLMSGKAGAMDLLLSDEISITGSRIGLGRFFALIDKAPGTFPIVTR